MASQAPVFVQNENLHIHRGKGVDGVKADVLKPMKTGRKDRKALEDLSKVSKPPVFGIPKGSTLKKKSAVRGPETIKKNSKSSLLTDEEIKRCHEWAKEGIEHMPFTGNDSQKLQRDKEEERVKKKVEKVMSALREWTNMSYDLGLPVKVVAKDYEDIMEMELEPEVLPHMPGSLSTTGGRGIEDFFLEPELDRFPFVDHTFQLKRNEDYDSDVSCV